MQKKIHFAKMDDLERIVILSYTDAPWLNDEITSQ